MIRKPTRIGVLCGNGPLNGGGRPKRWLAASLQGTIAIKIIGRIVDDTLGIDLFSLSFLLIYFLTFFFFFFFPSFFPFFLRQVKQVIRSFESAVLVSVLVSIELNGCSFVLNFERPYLGEYEFQVQHVSVLLFPINPISVIT